MQRCVPPGRRPRPGRIPTRALTASASPASNLRCRRRRSAPGFRCTPSSTTSGILPTSDATTAVPQAIASRLTIPAARTPTGTRNRCCGENFADLANRQHLDPEHPAAGLAPSCSTAAPTSGGDLRVSGAPAHSTSWTSGIEPVGAATRCGHPFCRVIRPTNATIGRPGRRPAGSAPNRRDPVVAGCHTPVSIPFLTTHAGGIQRDTPAARPRASRTLTAITASAASTAVRSTQDDTGSRRRAVPAFHGRSGSSECAVRTCGTPYSRAQVTGHPGVPGCECTTSRRRPRWPSQIGRQRRQRRVGAGQRRIGPVGERRSDRAAAPHAVHVDLAQPAQLGDEFGDMYACTAMQTSGGYSRVIIATRIPRPTAPVPAAGPRQECGGARPPTRGRKPRHCAGHLWRVSIGLSP